MAFTPEGADRHYYRGEGYALKTCFGKKAADAYITAQSEDGEVVGFGDFGLQMGALYVELEQTVFVVAIYSTFYINPQALGCYNGGGEQGGIYVEVFIGATHCFG